MTLIPHYSDLSLLRHYAGQLRAGTEACDPSGFSECLEDLCLEIEQMRGCVAELRELKGFLDSRNHFLSAKMARLDGLPSLQWRQVQEIHRKHTHDKTISETECLERIVRLVQMWAEYKAL